MYGAIIRAAIFAPVAWVIAFIIGQIASVALDIMASGPRGKSADAYQYLKPVAENTLLIMLLALLIMLLAAAVRERRIGGGV